MGHLNKRDRRTLKKRHQEENPVPYDYVIWRITNGPICKLLEIGKGIHSTEFAVRYYRNPRHPMFHNNKDALRHALRKEFSNASHWRKHYFFDVLFSYETFREYTIAQSLSRRKNLLSQFDHIWDEEDIQYITELNRKELEEADHAEQHP